MTKQETTELPVAGADDDKDKFLNDSESCLLEITQERLSSFLIWRLTSSSAST